MSRSIHFCNLFLIIAAIFCLNADCVYGQEKNLKQYEQIELKEFYDAKGVILPSDFELNISIVNHRTRFTPTVEEIARAEKILSKIVNMILGSAASDKELANKNMRSYYRQYMGVIKENGNKLIVLATQDFSNPETSELLKIWPASFICPLDKWTQYYRIFMINIDTGEIDEDSDPILDEYWFLKRKRTKLGKSDRYDRCNKAG